MPGRRLPSWGVTPRGAAIRSAFAARLRTGTALGVLPASTASACCSTSAPSTDDEVRDLARAVQYALEGDDVGDGGLSRGRRAPRRSRDGRPRRSRQVLADRPAHRHRSRPLGRGEASRPHDRPRLRLDARSRAGARSGSSTCPATSGSCGNMLAGVGPVRARAVRRRRRRGVEAAVRGAPADPRRARRGGRRGRAHEARPRGRRDARDRRRTRSRERVAGTALEGAPIVAVSSVTGEGLEQLRAALDAMLADAPAPEDGRARLLRRPGVHDQGRGHGGHGHARGRLPRRRRRGRALPDRAPRADPIAADPQEGRGARVPGRARRGEPGGRRARRPGAWRRARPARERGARRRRSRPSSAPVRGLGRSDHVARRLQAARRRRPRRTRACGSSAAAGSSPAARRSRASARRGRSSWTWAIDSSCARPDARETVGGGIVLDVAPPRARRTGSRGRPGHPRRGPARRAAVSCWRPSAAPSRVADVDRSWAPRRRPSSSPASGASRPRSATSLAEVVVVALRRRPRRPIRWPRARRRMAVRRAVVAALRGRARRRPRSRSPTRSSRDSAADGTAGPIGRRRSVSRRTASASMSAPRSSSGCWPRSRDPRRPPRPRQGARGRRLRARRDRRGRPRRGGRADRARARGVAPALVARAEAHDRAARRRHHA